MLAAVTGEHIRGAALRESELHPFRRWFEDLQIGDSLLTYRRTVSEADNPMDANGVGQGVVAWDVEVTNQLDELVASYDILTLVAKRGAG